MSDSEATTNTDNNQEVGTQEADETPVPISINGAPVAIKALRLSEKRSGQVIAHREIGIIPQKSGATVADDGTIHSELRGSPAQGESVTLDVCRALFGTLQQRGHRWHLPQLAGEHDDCDCVSQSLDCLDDHLRVQLVRALIDTTAWRELAQRGMHASQTATREMAEALRDTVAKKAARTSPVQRKQLALAIDATTTSAFALGPVISAFRSHYGEWCKGLDFIAVWLIGPSSEMTYRIDEPDPADAA